MTSSRREFLKCTAAAAAGASAGKAAWFAPVERPVEGIIEIGSRRELLLDDALIASTSALSKVVPRPEKCSDNPVLRADRPWEPAPGEPGGYGVGVPSVIFDTEQRRFRMWYLSTGPLGRRFCCHAVSDDGRNWKKPELGIFDYRGSKQNNIWSVYDDPCFTCIFIDPHDPDPSRRYKATGEWERGQTANTSGGLVVAFSPDGFHWTLPAENPVIPHGRNFGDAPGNAFWDPRRAKYVAYPRPGHSLAPEIAGAGFHRHIRSIGYAESDDFVRWSPTRPMIVPGSENRVDSQFESFRSIMLSDWYVGFVPVRQSFERTFEVFLVSSRDGFNWTWIDANRPFIQRGEVGSCDGAGMGSCSPVLHDDTVWMYYSSSRYMHAQSPNNHPGTFDQSAICLATCRADRFAGLLAGPSFGSLVTRPVVFSGRQLRLDLQPAVPVDLNRAEALSKGQPQPPGFDSSEIRVALLDQSGGPIDGFGETRSVATDDGVVSWPGADLGSIAGRPVRLSLRYRNAALFGFQFR